METNGLIKQSLDEIEVKSFLKIWYTGLLFEVLILRQLHNNFKFKKKYQSNRIWGKTRRTARTRHVIAQVLLRFDLLYFDLLLFNSCLYTSLIIYVKVFVEL